MVEGSVVFSNVEILETRGVVPTVMESLTCDSRMVKPGALFVALKGQSFDGHCFVADAAERGACAAVVQEWCDPSDFPQIRLADTLASLPKIAANFYDYPARALQLIGVTGSNGKTTTTRLIEQTLKAADIEPAVLGTIDYRYGGMSVEAPNTTPLPHDMHRLLKEIVDHGHRWVVMEVSSHGLMLHRVDEMTFQTAHFCNLSQDHLDFHQTMEEYYQAKRRLFTEFLDEKGVAVINKNDPYGQRLIEELNDIQLVTFGIECAADVVAQDIVLLLHGCTFVLQFPDAKEIFVRSPLVGRHNVENMVGAAATAYACGLSPEAIHQGLEALSSVPGRLESIRNNVGAQVVVDYCHTPDALEKCLQTLCGLPHNRIITIVGCGGDRDPSKRAPMGEIALRYSHWVIVTNDNPRTEDPQSIIKDIENGMDGLNERYTVIENRREAIASAMEMLAEGDIVLIAGKGHETYQLIGHTKYPFDDRLVARECLIALGKGDE